MAKTKDGWERKSVRGWGGVSQRIENKALDVRLTRGRGYNDFWVAQRISTGRAVPLGRIDDKSLRVVKAAVKAKATWPRRKVKEQKRTLTVVDRRHQSAKNADRGRRAKVVLPANDLEALKEWRRDMGRKDLQGVDTPSAPKALLAAAGAGKGKKSKRKPKMRTGGASGASRKNTGGSRGGMYAAMTGKRR